MRTLIHTLFFFLLATQIGLGQWVQVGINDKVIVDIAAQNQNIFAVSADEKVFRSIDSGFNWTTIVDSFSQEVAITSTGNILLIKDFTSLYSSSDNGVTWVDTNIEAQLTDSFSVSLLRNLDISPGGLIFCDVVHPFSRGVIDGIGMSTNGGLEWYTPGTYLTGGQSFDFKNQVIITFGQYYGPTTSVFGITMSSDDGINWNLIRDDDPSNYYAICIGLFSNNNIILVSSNDCHMTSYGDSSWTKIATLSATVGLSWTNGSLEGMLIGTNTGVFLFSDMGDSLGSRNEGLTNLNIQSLSLDNNGYVYAGTENGVWRRPLSEITPVENQITQPTEYILKRNFPNPFNPSTVISYQLPVSSDVVLKVFDVLGNEIATLVNEEKPGGRYEVEFNASALPSGVYFYQLKAGEFVQTRKMILIK